MSWLSEADFTSVIAKAPLVSIDFIIEDTSTGNFLLGKRENRPAEGYWFVPGGRIQKGECIADAFERLTQDELGSSIEYSGSHWFGLYEHMYDDCVFGDVATTHYVVLAHKLSLGQESLKLPSVQHGSYRWLSTEEILAMDTVHPYTKDYFKQATL